MKSFGHTSFRRNLLMAVVVICCGPPSYATAQTSCAVNGTCGNGYYCHALTLTCTLIDQYCDDDSDCNGDAGSCDTGCEVCLCDNNSQCPPEFGLCSPSKICTNTGLGAYCTENSECYSGSCDGNNKCVQGTKALGDACIFPDECANYSCSGGVCATSGSGGGDPHFITFQDVHYDWHGQCNAIFSRSIDLGFEVHTRTNVVDDGEISYSYISSVAAKVGTNTIEVSGEDGSIVVNGKHFPAFTDHANTPDEYPITGTSSPSTLTKTHRGRKHLMVVYTWVIGAKRSLRISANTKSGIVSVDLKGSFPNGEGLLGSTSTKALLGRDGVTDFAGDYIAFAEEWQVRDTDEKIFSSAFVPEYPDKCIYGSSPALVGEDPTHMKKVNLRRRLMNREQEGAENMAVTMEEANQACENVVDAKKKYCVMDVFSLGDVDLAEDLFYY